MNTNDNLQNFSDIPSLSDTEGLESFMQNEALKEQGLPPVTQDAQPVQEQPTQQPQVEDNSSALKAPENYTSGQISQILAQLDNINRRLNASQPQAPAQTAAYSNTERNFITEALNRGYSIDQINQVILQRRNAAAATTSKNVAIESRIAAMEEYLRSQEYKTAETAFINKISAFGDKWGLSEQDLVTFGNAALSKGINIAMPNTDLEAIFRAVFPEQYAIRSQRMTPTNTSQIFGGTSVPENYNRTSSRAEDAYVESFLKNSMPNQYGMLNKK